MFTPVGLKDYQNDGKGLHGNVPNESNWSGYTNKSSVPSEEMGGMRLAVVGPCSAGNSPNLTGPQAYPAWFLRQNRNRAERSNVKQSKA